MLRTLVAVIGTALYLLLVGAPVLIWSTLTRNDALMFRWGVRGARVAMWLAGVRIRVEGRDRLQRDQTYVFMSNHVGNAEPPALVVSLPRVAALLKHELLRIPILGGALRLTGFIPVVRGSQQAAAAVDLAVDVLRSGRNLLVFPEGTRSISGEMLPFRRGVFLMAIRAGVPVVPITVLGSREIMRKGDYRIRPGEVRIIIHEPIPTAGLREEDRHELADRVRGIIASAIPGAAPPAAIDTPAVV